MKLPGDLSPLRHLDVSLLSLLFEALGRTFFSKSIFSLEPPTTREEGKTGKGGGSPKG